MLTGYRPTGPLHVGHWAGNIESMLALQADPSRECFFFLADWHMLNTHYDRTDELPGFVHELVLDWLAAGIDPERATVYRQSDLPEVAELALLLGTITPLGWLERVPSFKERLRDMAERDVANYGLLGYPVLQTADIAIVRGALVPVGEDQVAHLEVSREIVRRFNRLYGEVLVEPQPLLSETPLIPGSDGRKMSKSLDNAIWVRDEEDAIRASVRSFITDPKKVRRGRPGAPRDLPDLRAAAEVLARTHRRDRGGVPLGRARVRRLQDDLGRPPDRVLPALSGAPLRARRRARPRRAGARRRRRAGAPGRARDARVGARGDASIVNDADGEMR